MASLIIFSLVLCSFSIAADAQQRQFNISLGSSLKPNTKNSSWVSPSGLYAFGFYPQGNGYAVGVFLAGIPQKTVVWTARRDDPPVSSDVTLLFSSDSGLVLRSAQGQNTNIVPASQSASSASVSDSGNFVIYDSNQQIIWQSFDHPNDTLLPGQRLQAGTELFSSVSETDKSKGIFRIKMQNDGNLVQYPVETPDTGEYAYWASGTDGSGENVTLNLDPNGHLYLLNAKGVNIKDLEQGGNLTNETIYSAKIDADGIFRLYSYNLTENGNWSIAWSSTKDKCSPKGLCGLNGYCTLNDLEPQCECIPGFSPVHQGNRSSGCERNFVAESCKEENVSTKYSIQELANTVWLENSYSTLSSASKGDCEKACLEDCNCEAVFYEDGQCKKQSLPLKYGRTDPGNSNSALIKVGMLKSVSDPGLDRIVP
uniref:Serine/threonine-protein kinase n=1 Tax=Rhizophora mucronata TaxID=61149 RepID=A0A2P2JRF0_RHIMU